MFLRLCFCLIDSDACKFCLVFHSESDFCLWEQIHLLAEISFISVLVLTWAGNDCDYLGWAGREWPESAESVFKSEPERKQQKLV